MTDGENGRCNLFFGDGGRDAIISLAAAFRLYCLEVERSSLETYTALRYAEGDINVCFLN